jgi:hypothetical protein
MLRHAVKLRNEKIIRETGRETVYWDGAMGYKWLRKEEKGLTQSFTEGGAQRALRRTLASQ